MGEADTIRGVWRGALSIIAKYPLATLVPAAVFGAFGEIPTYLIEGRTWLDLVLTVAGLLRAYYLYFAHARGLIQPHKPYIP